MAEKVVEHFLVNNFAERAAGRTSCGTADETGDYGSGNGPADRTDRRSYEHAGQR